MANAPRMIQGLGQEMLLLPKMLQSIQLLQLSGLELEEFLRNAVEENEALTLEPRDELDGPAPALPNRTSAREATQRHDEWLESQPERPRGLGAALEEQLALVDLDPATEHATRFLVEHLDENGYLPFEDQDLLERALAAGLALDAATLARGKAVLHAFEPRGIGARNAIEALLLQLDASDPDFADLQRLLLEFVGELARNKLPSVANAMGLSIPALKELLAKLAALDPRPARDLTDSSSPAIVPEVLVEPTADGSYEVRVDGSLLPAVALDEDIVALARERRQEPQVKAYLRDKVDRARWIVDALEQRGRTLLLIARAVFERQRAFLDDGPSHIAPLRMNELAEQLGVHTSTVSRAVAGKHVQTPWGIFALRHFFQSAVGAGEELARDDLRERVKALFEAEDGAAPLSDDDVVRRLAAQGVQVARRTVTKYRKDLGLPSSYRRRVY
jgi:RNA polymerase sigma-54 factor